MGVPMGTPGGPYAPSAPYNYMPTSSTQAYPAPHEPEKRRESHHRSISDRDRDRDRAHDEDRETLDRLGREGVTKLLDGALESLYRDRIKPLANYVRGRLKERTCPQIVVKTFLDLYSQRPEFFLVQKPEDTALDNRSAAD